ncbi:MAG: T9SS type A sorting domain-containing protein [Spirochaetes bacterium]|nr:T9SS type A sorting domain-containing protein [Spirochaetota bacterium]
MISKRSFCHIFIIAWHLFVCQIAGTAGPYFDSIWPVEHGDPARHQFINKAGLNLNLNLTLTILTRGSYDLPVFPFTRKTNELYLIGGTPSVTIAQGWIAKLDPDSLQTQVITFLTNGSLTWSPSAVIHSNGFIYAVSSHYIYKLDSNLNIVNCKLLPGDPEGESNLLILNDGRLIAKGGHRVLGTRSSLVVLDPSDLSVLEEVILPELSRGRMSLYTFTNLECAYCIGETTVWRYAYDPVNCLTFDSNWSFNYMDKLPDSSYGNAPTFIGSNLYMMNNSDPLNFAANDPIYVFRINLSDASNYDRFQPFPGITNGFSLSKMAADPTNNIIFPMDSRNGFLGALRYTGGIPVFETLWIKQFKATGIFAGSIMDNEFYINHYDGFNDWFVVLDEFMGSEKARIRTPSLKATYGALIMGFNKTAYYAGGGYICKIFPVQRTNNDLTDPHGFNPLAGPNPYKSNGPFYFTGITQGTKIRIYTITGALITSLVEEDNDGVIIWDVRNSSGKDLASGVYLCHIKSSSGQSKLMKIMVIR